MKSAFRIGVLLVSAAVLQRGLFSRLRVADVAVDLFLLLAVTAGITGGPDRGAVVGFFAGLTLDLLVQTPLGLSALVYCLTAYLAGRLQSQGIRANRAVPVVLVAAISAVGVGLYAVVGEMVGQSNAVSSRLPVIMLVVSVGNALLFPLARRLMTWAWADEVGLRPALH